MAPGIDINWDALAGLRRGRRREDAACLEGRRRRPLLLRRQLEAMEDGGLVVIVGAGQSLPLPARSLRARQPDRLLPEDLEAQVEAADPRRQGRLLQAAPVPECLGRALSRPDRMGVAVSKGGKVTSVDPATLTLVDRLRQPQGRRRQRHPAAEGRRASPQLAGVADRTGWCPVEPVAFEIDAAARHPCAGRCRHHGRHAQVGLRRQCAGQGLRRGASSSCWPAASPSSRA